MNCETDREFYLRSAILSLGKEWERIVIVKLFWEGETLKSLGRELGKSHQRIYQIKRDALRKIKQYIFVKENAVDPNVARRYQGYPLLRRIMSRAEIPRKIPVRISTSAKTLPETHDLFGTAEVFMGNGRKVMVKAKTCGCEVYLCVGGTWCKVQTVRMGDGLTTVVYDHTGNMFPLCNLQMG